MPTTTELATSIMKRIGVLDPRENPSANDAADVIAVMNSVYETEKELGRFNWTLTSIPTRYREWFYTYVGFFVQPRFGVQTVTADDAMFAMRKMSALNEQKQDPRSSPVTDY